MLTRVAGRAATAVVDRHGEGHGARLLRRRPRRLPRRRVRQRAGLRRPRVGERIAIRILRVGRHRRRASDLDRARVARGLDGRRPVGRRNRSRWRWRRRGWHRWRSLHAAAAGVEADPELNAGVVPRLVVERGEDRRARHRARTAGICLARPSIVKFQLPAAADEEPVRRLPGQAECEKDGTLDSRHRRHEGSVLGNAGGR